MKRDPELYSMEINETPSEGVIGWRIGYGESNFLVAEGSAWSLPEGKEIFRRLKNGGLLSDL